MAFQKFPAEQRTAGAAVLSPRILISAQFTRPLKPSDVTDDVVLRKMKFSGRPPVVDPDAASLRLASATRRLSSQRRRSRNAELRRHHHRNRAGGTTARRPAGRNRNEGCYHR